jgi:CubicO group peptidase (beta-lactamase class C family)
MEPSVNKSVKLKTEYKQQEKRYQSLYTKTWPNNSMNGSLLVAKNGQIIFEKYEGMANFRSKRPITATTPLHLASVSKVITATAILKLIDNKIN